MSPPPGSPSRAPMERYAHLQSLFYVSFRVPNKGSLPLGSLYRAPTERHSTPRAPFNHISKSPVDEPLPGFPVGPLWKEMPISRGSSTYPPGSPAREPSRLPSQSSHRESEGGGRGEMPHLQSPFQPFCKVLSRRAHSRLPN